MTATALYPCARGQRIPAHRARRTASSRVTACDRTGLTRRSFSDSALVAVSPSEVDAREVLHRRLGGLDVRRSRHSDLSMMPRRDCWRLILSALVDQLHLLEGDSAVLCRCRRPFQLVHDAPSRSAAHHRSRPGPSGRTTHRPRRGRSPSDRVHKRLPAFTTSTPAFRSRSWWRGLHLVSPFARGSAAEGETASFHPSEGPYPHRHLAAGSLSRLRFVHVFPRRFLELTEDALDGSRRRLDLNEDGR